MLAANCDSAVVPSKTAGINSVTHSNGEQYVPFLSPEMDWWQDVPVALLHSGSKALGIQLQ
jgi:hypothetical protein